LYTTGAPPRESVRSFTFSTKKTTSDALAPINSQVANKD
jgi:hypothetical protein